MKNRTGNMGEDAKATKDSEETEEDKTEELTNTVTNFIQTMSLIQ